MMLGLGLLWSHKDRISFEVPFHITNQAPPLSFAIFRKKLEGEIIENYQDLKTMGKKYKVEGVSEKLTLVTDHQEMIPWFFDKHVKDFLKKFEKSIDIIQVSDRMTFFRTYSRSYADRWPSAAPSSCRPTTTASRRTPESRPSSSSG